MPASPESESRPNPDALGDEPSSATDHARRDRYEQLLAEAQAIKGVSLWKDAWRRLRQNWAAMGSLGVLITVSLLAFFTPLLPLQSPIDQDLKNRLLLPPDTTVVYLGQREALRFEDNSLTAQLAQFDQRLSELSQKRSQAATADERAALDEQLQQIRESENPLLQLWHRPGPISQAMIRIRLAIFGDWSLPSWAGTDALGRDLLARLFWGARVSLIVGVVATFVSLVIGVTYGAVAGYAGGAVDAIMMRIVDVLYSVPFIFVVIFLITFLTEESIKKTYLEPFGINQIMIFYVVIGAIYWLTMSRVVRGQIISLKNEQFVEAARTIGASRARIIFRHLVPNVMGIVIVYLTLTIPAVMLFEAFLSFLGMGVQPPDVSWGLLANEGIKVITPIRIYWWVVLFPSTALALTLFALNFLGDGLRDALDPRMRTR